MQWWCGLVLVAAVGCGRISFESQPQPGANDAVPDSPMLADGLVAQFLFENDIVDDRTTPSTVGGWDPLCDYEERPDYSCPSGGMQNEIGRVAGGFDGELDCLPLVYDARLDVRDGFTISAWVWIQEPLLDVFGSILQKRFGSAQGNSWGLDVHPDGDGSYLAEFTTPLITNLQSQRHIAPRTGTHLAITWDGQTKRIYVDGAFDGEQSVGPIENDMNDATLGCDVDPLGVTSYFRGYLDDVRLYNRALSSAEIQQLAQLTLP